MIVILGFSLLCCVMFAIGVVTNVAMEMAENPVPRRGPLRRLAVARTARREAADIDAEYRDLLRF